MPSARKPSKRRTPKERAPAGRKARQLASQVARTVDQLLAGELDDEVLRGLCVTSVVPAPDESRLLVTVGPMAPGITVDVPRVLARLAAASNHIRAEVAATITRKKAPSLTYQVLPVFLDQDAPTMHEESATPS
jgi:ribosome-binding factor A